MKLITVISDGLVKREYFENVISKYFDLSEFKIDYFNWHEELNKEEFQNKMDYIETNGPNFFEPSDELLESLKECTFLFAHIAPINKKMLSVCEKIELIGICRGGTENIDLAYCKERNIPVIRSVKNAIATAEFTVGLMLSLTRNISKGYLSMLDGKWEKNYFNDGYRITLQEMTIGIIGIGNIGKEVSRILSNIGSEVLVFHPNITEDKMREVDLPVRYVSLDELLANSDIISLHLRLNAHTKNIITEKELYKMKKSAYLINTGRAGLINEHDVVATLKEKRILGAALDVYWDEPLSVNHPLVQLPNVLLTPHIAGDTDVIDKAPLILLQEVKKYLSTGFSSMLIKEKYMNNK